MAFLVINRCCCLCLRTGGIIIGVLGVLVSLLILITCAADVHTHNVTKLSEGDYINRMIKDMVFRMIGSTTYLIASILLIVGIVKNSHLMLLPWLITHIVVFAFTIPVILFNTVILFVFDVKSEKPLHQLIVASTFLFLGLFIWIIIYSLYINTRNEKRIPRQIDNKINYSPYYEADHFDI